MPTLKQKLANINITGLLRFDEPMSKHTTYEVGGPADVYVRPRSTADVAAVLRAGREQGTPVFTLGGGANILVADAGIRGIVMDMREFAEIRVEGAAQTPGDAEAAHTRSTDTAPAPDTRRTPDTLDTPDASRRATARVGAGLAVSDAAAHLADRGLAGLDFLYAMPGSVGGAVWMNARCYGSSIIDILTGVEMVTPNGEFQHYTPREGDFAYKISPFQPAGRLAEAVIVAAHLALWTEPREQIRARMREHEEDRTNKGHFSGPSAGSVFKNNRDFGKPSGRLIDSLGLRGYQVGGARISDQHANIIINTGDASAADIRTLMDYVQEQVHERLGLQLEREVLLVGEWPDADATPGGV